MYLCEEGEGHKEREIGRKGEREKDTERENRNFYCRKKKNSLAWWNSVEISDQKHRTLHLLKKIFCVQDSALCNGIKQETKQTLENLPLWKLTFWWVAPDSPPDYIVNRYISFTRSFQYITVRPKGVEEFLLSWVKHNLAGYFVFLVDLNNTRIDFQVYSDNKSWAEVADGIIYCGKGVYL